METSSPGNRAVCCGYGTAAAPLLPPAAQEKDKDIGYVCTPKKKGGKEDTCGVVCLLFCIAEQAPRSLDDTPQPLTFWFLFSLSNVLFFFFNYQR